MGLLLTRNINHKYLVKARPFSSAKVSCINDYVKPALRDFNPEHIILHVGTSDLNTERTADSSLKTDANTITVSLIVPRYDNLNNKTNEVNGRFMNMCKERNISHIIHADTISPLLLLLLLILHFSLTNLHGLNSSNNLDRLI